MLRADVQQMALEALHELLEWEELERSPRLALFLRYVVERTLADRASGLKAYSIAVDVFERPADFDPQTDPIVRVQAARLRALLEKFYGGGLNRVPLRISIPIGRYVPNFETWQVQSADVEAGGLSVMTPQKEDAAVISTPIRAGLSRTTFRVILALLLFSMLIVLVAIWFLLTKAERVEKMPQEISVTGFEKPTVRVSTFENLTGVEKYDAPIAGLASQLVSNLSRFEDLRVEHGPLSAYVEKLVVPRTGVIAPVYVLSGAARREGSEINVDALLTRANVPEVVWTYSIRLLDTTEDFPQAVARVARSFSAVLGSHRGPLHIQSLQRLSLDKEALGPPSVYPCLLLDTLARDVSSVDNLRAAADCFKSLPVVQPQAALALAGWAGNSAMIARAQSLLGDPMVDVLFEQTQAVRKAIEMSPQSNFVRGQLARVMSAQHALQQASIAHIDAIERNPADMDALAEYALHLAYMGDLDGAIELMERVAREGVAAPSWYQIVPALKGLRDRDYNSALASALNVMGGDPELGMVLALSAAPLAARGDVVSRFAKLALQNENFQRMGILPWVSRLITDESVLRLLEPGLQLAGLPSEAIRHPFLPKQR